MQASCSSRTSAYFASFGSASKVRSTRGRNVHFRLAASISRGTRSWRFHTRSVDVRTDQQMQWSTSTYGPLTVRLIHGKWFKGRKQINLKKKEMAQCRVESAWGTNPSRDSSAEHQLLKPFSWCLVHAHREIFRLTLSLPTFVPRNSAGHLA